MITQTTRTLFRMTLIDGFMSTGTTVTEFAISHDFKLPCLQLNWFQVITYENVESIFNIDQGKRQFSKHDTYLTESIAISKPNKEKVTIISKMKIISLQ